MLFNSYTFVLFFACILAVHYSSIPWRFKKLSLLLGSYLFYAAWNPPFVFLLWLSTIADWFLARRIHASTSRGVRLTLLIGSLAINLGILAFFKYGGFVEENFAATALLLGIHFEPVLPSIILPVGISFYTFQTLSYTIDIYRNRAKPWSSLLDFALYVTFFPQLVAGPIVRSHEFLPQCLTLRKASWTDFDFGLTLFLVGMFEKVVIADSFLAPIVEAVFDSAESPTTVSAWCGTLAFSGQIFCDFAGYSSCAIGVAMCLGFVLPQNFRFPYSAIGFSDFWQRWHVSLSTWLRDYLYIPLGGNRSGPVRTGVNLLITMLLGGLWHGASWTFVFWGFLHGLFLCMERIVRTRFTIPTPTTLRPVLALGTFVVVCFTWVFFRANSLSQAFAIAAAMLGATTPADTSLLNSQQIMTATVCVTTILLIQWFMRERSLRETLRTVPWWCAAPLTASLILAIATTTNDDRAFIYFQF